VLFDPDPIPTKGIGNRRPRGGPDDGSPVDPLVNLRVPVEERETSGIPVVITGKVNPLGVCMPTAKPASFKPTTFSSKVTQTIAGPGEETLESFP
jgi:hypothetical protein